MKVKPKEVHHILRWHDAAAVGTDYSHNDMHLKYAMLVASWKAFKQGQASDEQQVLCYEIHKCLMKGLANGDRKIPAMMQGARVQNLVTPDRRFTDRKEMSVKDAIQRIAEMDGKSFEAVRKQWDSWKSADPEAKQAVIDQNMSFKKNDFV